jgi:transcriptional regulator with XRE-family HTH domain
MTTTGERIKKRRIELGITQDELAHRIGFESRSAITKIEKSDRNLNQSKIKLIADALQTTQDYIMGWGEEQTTDQADIQILIEYYSGMTESSRDALLNYAKFLSKQKEGD